MIGYCGLYCGECFSHVGRISELARELRDELRKNSFHKISESICKCCFFEVFKYYTQSFELLGILEKFRCRGSCREGFGPPFCKIRKCCLKKGLEGCWECPEFEGCDTLDFLKDGHGEAHLKNLRIIKNKGIEEFINGSKYWYSDPQIKNYKA
ncbi:DUF3795 domain-containing protein [bacterium]|nr:DUF3795 domain-containing protein [bacterium]